MPSHPDSAEEYFRRAAALTEQGRLDEAVAALQQTLRLQPDSFSAHYHLGNALSLQGKLPQATACYREAVRLQPDHATALTDLGVALARQGALAEAVATLRRAVHARPDFAKAHLNLGVALAETRQLEEAAAALRWAIDLRPDYAEAHFNLGNVLDEMGKRSEAVPCFERALECKPDHADALNNLGLALCRLGRPGPAAIALQQAVRLRPDHVEALNNLGLAYADQGRFVEAIAAHDRALALNPRHVAAHTNLGNAYKEQGRLEEAVACYQQALWFQPDSASTHWNRSLAWLQMGDFERGWPEYEWRWRRPRTVVRPFRHPLWDGSPLHGRTILLYMEQGLGDMMQFLRYAPLVQRRGGSVVLECPAGLLPLFGRCPGIDRLVAEGAALPPFDVHCPLLSLPARLGTTVATIPGEVPYLSAEPERVERWQARLARETAFKIGIAWQGNPHHPWDRHRSPPLAAFAALARVPGVRLYSLQQGAGLEQLSQTQERVPVTVLAEELDSRAEMFRETAALMKCLDLVISADTAVAHLAGALGGPVWVALSTIVDWRWLRGRDDSPWYPTLRLFRQRRLGEWEPVFERIAEEVRQRIG